MSSFGGLVKGLHLYLIGKSFFGRVLQHFCEKLIEFSKFDFLEFNF